MARLIESLFLDGPAGRLEALLEEPEVGEPGSVCVVCHPHPLYGGTMRNKVVHRIAKAMRLSGAAVLRFNFRGVEGSGGAHAHGVGEIDDARVALEWLRARHPGLPFSLAGFSFGSRVALKLGCSTEDAQRVIAVGYPAARDDNSFLETCTAAKFFVHGALDDIAPLGPLEALMPKIAEPKRLDVLPGTGHFFEGALDALEDAVLRITKPA